MNEYRRASARRLFFGRFGARQLHGPVAVCRSTVAVQDLAMAHEAQAAAQDPQKLVIHNIGLLLSGKLEAPIADADTVVAVNGRISAIGRSKMSIRTGPRM